MFPTNNKKLEKENDDGNRHEFKMIHGYRKAFKTICENAGMKSINIKLLLDHNKVLSSSYYKPKQQEVLGDYLKNIVNDLAIDESHRLQKQVQELKGENA